MSIGSRATRLLAVLAVVLGVLAMHGLVGGHHGSVSIVAGPTASDVNAHSAEHAVDRLIVVQDGLLSAAAAATAPVHDLTDSCDGGCSEHASGLLLLCVAVLLAVGVARARRLADRTWRSTPSTGPPTNGRPRSTAPNRRWDLVADLCISRT